MFNRLFVVRIVHVFLLSSFQTDRHSPPDQTMRHVDYSIFVLIKKWACIPMTILFVASRRLPSPNRVVFFWPVTMISIAMFGIRCVSNVPVSSSSSSSILDPSMDLFFSVQASWLATIIVSVVWVSLRMVWPWRLAHGIVSWGSGINRPLALDSFQRTKTKLD